MASGVFQLPLFCIGRVQLTCPFEICRVVVALLDPLGFSGLVTCSVLDRISGCPGDPRKGAHQGKGSGLRSVFGLTAPHLTAAHLTAPHRTRARPHTRKHAGMQARMHARTPARAPAAPARTHARHGDRYRARRRQRDRIRLRLHPSRPHCRYAPAFFRVYNASISLHVYADELPPYWKSWGPPLSHADSLLLANVPGRKLWHSAYRVSCYMFMLTAAKLHDLAECSSSDLPLKPSHPSRLALARGRVCVCVWQPCIQGSSRPFSEFRRGTRGT